ncbi:FAD/FMN-containing dehydrogenase [Ilyonectria robusta]
MNSLRSLLAVAALCGLSSSFEYNTFDGEGHPSCYNVTAVYDPKSVDEIVDLVKKTASKGLQVRAGAKGHMWYDTQCSDDETVIIRTEHVNNIWDLDLDKGTVMVEAGVTFFQLAEYLHENGANIGTGLVNWNISLGGSIAMGAHRTSLREDAVVVGGVLAMDIIDGKGEIRHIERDESDDDWLAASTSLGILGIIARIKMQVFPETKVWAMQKTDQEGFQSTFSVTELEAVAARTLLDSGKYLPSSNWLMEEIFFGLWDKPNFHDKSTDEEITKWPVYGYNYDVLIGGLYPGQKPEWDYDLRGYTLELAFPVTRANEMLKRVRQLFDAEAKKLIFMTSTYRSGINIKFSKPHYDFLGQSTVDTADGQDWSKGAIMFDFPSYRPTVGDHKRYNEQFCELMT